MKKILLTLAALSAALPASAWERMAGQWSGVDKPRQAVVSDRAAWERLWAEHSKTEPLPEVDFNKEVVAGVFLGVKPGAGWTIELDAAPDQKGGLSLSWREVAPKGGFGATVMARPFVLRKLAKTGAVRFPGQASAALPGAREAEVAEGGRRAAAVIASVGFSPKVFDAVSSVGFAPSAVLAQLPPPPGQDQDTTRRGRDQDRERKPLPPPPGQGGKPLPPPPGQGGDRKPLPPPPGQGKPLPPPPGPSHPRPVYPGGPLPNDRRLDNAEQVYDPSGMEYLGYWEGEQYYENGSGRVETRPTDRGSAYVLNLESRKYQQYIKFYYANGRYYYTKVADYLKSRSRRVVVDFVDRAQNPLLPWEKESFLFSFNGARSQNDGLRIEAADGAYRYDVSFVSDPSDPMTVTVIMRTREKLRTAPDHNGVKLSMGPDGKGSLQLVIEDKHASYYAGETIEISYVVRKDDGSFWRRDPVVSQADYRSPFRVVVQGGAGRWTATLPNTSGSGTYYLESWSFRRAASRLSTDGWIGKGEGNKVSK